MKNIPTPEQYARLQEIQKAIGDYKAAIVAGKEARRAIKSLTAEADTIWRGGPPKPRKPRAPKAATTPAPEIRQEEPPRVVSAGTFGQLVVNAAKAKKGAK